MLDEVQIPVERSSHVIRYLACWVVTYILTAYPLSSFAVVVLPFGNAEIKRAGEGCVGGYTTKGMRVTFYRSGTTHLNERLSVIKQLENEYRHKQITVNPGAGTVTLPIDLKATSASTHSTSPTSVDWVTYEIDPKILWFISQEPESFAPSKSPMSFFQPVVPLRLTETKSILIVVWTDGNIRLHELEIPSGIAVRSGEEIERIAAFVASRQKQQ
jgi:hypothetical protein